MTTQTGNHTETVTPTHRLDLIIRTLRGSQGCPWDQKQTPESLKKYLLEETSELAEAIDQGDPAHICEEIGDVYFILNLLTLIYEAREEFTADDALNGIIKKMLRRHPHVFEHSTNATEEELREQWKRIKAEEKVQNRSVKG